MIHLGHAISLQGSFLPPLSPVLRPVTALRRSIAGNIRCQQSSCGYAQQGMRGVYNHNWLIHTPMLRSRRETQRADSRVCGVRHFSLRMWTE